MLKPKVESRTLRSRDSKKKSENRLFEDRPSRVQGQECSRPRTKDTILQVFSDNNKKKVVPQQTHIFSKISGDTEIELEIEGKVELFLVIFLFHESCCPRAEDRAFSITFSIIGLEAKAKNFKMCPLLENSTSGLIPVEKKRFLFQ